MASRGELLGLLTLTGIALLISAYQPYDRLTWWMEALPVVVGMPLLVVSYRAFPLTRLLYYLLFIHGLILVLGGHYSYARVPIGFWAQDWFDLTRNHYDRLGHVAQGFIPAILAREILIRLSPLTPGGWLFLIVTSICLAFSAVYELIEWFAAVLLGGDAETFLATQGDIWDTQWDMFLALCGALAAQLLLARLHDAQLGRVAART